ncbi:HAMP domain-containing protein [bacterium]|nr:HAMP domain-containing protein [bacterium]
MQTPDSKGKRLLVLAAFAGLACLVNLFPVPLLPGIHFVLGSAVVMVAAIVGGPWWGLVAGMASALPTLVYWADPPALLRYGFEGFFVGALARRWSPLVSAPLFWLVFGIPSEVALTDGWPLSDTVRFALFAVGFKQLLNALICATLAETLLLVPPVRRWLRGAISGAYLPAMTLRKLVLILAMLAASIPILVLTATGSREFGELWGQRAEAIAQNTASEAALAIQRRFANDGAASQPEDLKAELEARLAEDPTHSVASFALVAGDGRVLVTVGNPLPEALVRRLPFAGPQGTVSIAAGTKNQPVFLQELDVVRGAYVTLVRGPWQVVAVIDHQVLLQEVTRRLSNALIVLAVLLACALVLARLMTPLLTRPLGRLRQALHAVADGDLSTRAGREELVEIDDLGQSFNATTSRLEENVHALQEANEKLQRAMARLTELDKVKWTFLNAVSHDLRIPLTSIVGYAEFLQEGMGGKLGDEQLQFVDQILKSSDYMTRLLNELLDFARLEAGRFKIEPTEFDYGPFLQETCAKFEYEAERKGLTLSVEPPSAPITLVADPDRLIQVLNNLLSNAIKFTPTGGRITVKACKEADGRTRTEVNDTGLGIPPEAVPHLFDQFFQTEAGKKAGGTGLGLPIVRTIVEAHGGEVGVDSAPGKGSSFWFTLPATPPAT